MASERTAYISFDYFIKASLTFYGSIIVDTRFFPTTDHQSGLEQLSDKSRESMKSIYFL